MQDSLNDYVQKKIHQDIRLQKWSEIIVRGAYLRNPPARQADCEDQNKLSNMHRPTTSILSPDTLAVNCFPGADYIEHYASLIATYLALSGDNSTVVLCQRPTAQQCTELLLNSNIRALGPVDVVVIGYNYQLTWVQRQDWQGQGSDGDLFSWQKQILPNGTTVAYLTCPFSFWGETSGHLVTTLHHFSHMKCLLYFGKAGTLRPEVSPNGWLVTGEASYIGQELVTWRNVLAPECAMSEKVLTGDIVTVDSPLCESFDWLDSWQSKGSWVDCEVGHIARACKADNISFGYLHIVSDRVSTRCEEPENLANEQTQRIRDKRRGLFDVVESILSRYLARVGAIIEP